MSDVKETNNEILKICEEMSRWSCKKVGQFLDEINLGQYKKVSFSIRIFFLFKFSRMNILRFF